MSASQPSSPQPSPSQQSLVGMPLVVAGLVAAIVALLVVAVLGDIVTVSTVQGISSPWIWLHLGAASFILVLVGILGVVLRRQFAQMRALSEDLFEEEEKFRLYAELGSDWFWQTDAQHRFVEITGAHVEKSALPSEQVLGRTRFDLVRDGFIQADLDSPVWRQHAADLSQRLPFHNLVYSVGLAGNLKTLAVSGRPVFDTAGTFLGYRGIATDMTTEKRTERELREAKEAAETANSAKSEFLASMSHELRTPLNAVIGFSDMMMAEMFGPLGHAKYREYIRDIHNSGSHLLALINDVLDMSKIEAGRFELDESIVNLGSVVDTCLGMIEWRAAKNEVELGERPHIVLPNMIADERAVRQVVLNLLTNAVKFTPRGGRVQVAGGRDANGDILVAIADTGVGIPPEALERLFEPFQRASAHVARQQEGTGLGLAISRRLMEMHGGALEVESEVGEGTVVRIRFPASRVVTMPGQETEPAVTVG